MLNNGRDTIVSSDSFFYDSDYRMQSAGDTYFKGMTITPDSNKQTRVYYNLHGEYSKLIGQVAFEDKYADRIDKYYTINFYADDILVGSYSIYKGNMPIDISVGLNYCNKLIIELIRPTDDNSKNPNINLIEFELRY